ncbi:MAG: porin, partial [Psychrobium sp.]|nr:porin [Psychrobium sp.]
LPNVAFATQKSEVEQLKQQVEKLSQQLEKISVKSANAPTVKTKGGGLEVVSADGKKSLEVGGRFQLDFDTFDGAYNAENSGNTGAELFPRRVRTYVEGQADDWDYKLLLDFSEGAEITLARLRYKGFDNGPTIKVGKIREDISLEALTSSKHITAISRPMVANVMSPYFKYGISAYQYFKDSGLRYAIGAYKGAGFGSNGKDNNDNIALSYTGRLTWSPVHSGDKTLHFGLWASHRDFGGNTLGAKFARGEVRETNVRLVNYAAGGSTYAADSLEQYGLEFAAVNGPLSIQAEYAKREVNAVDAVNDGSFDGYYVTASYFLTGEHRVYKKRGVFNSPKPISSAGAWEIFARMSHFDATSATQGTEADVITLGANYYLNKKIKLMANYLMADVKGPGTDALVSEYTDGNALTVRIQYLF